MKQPRANGTIVTHAQAANMQRLAHDLALGLGNDLQQAKTRSERAMLSSKITTAISVWNDARRAVLEHRPKHKRIAGDPTPTRTNGTSKRLTSPIGIEEDPSMLSQAQTVPTPSTPGPPEGGGDQ